MTCCRLCGAVCDLYTGDGPRRVCKACVASMGRIVAAPATAHPNVIARLERHHLDVVDLAGDGWRWTSLWPTDHTLLRGTR